MQRATSRLSLSSLRGSTRFFRSGLGVLAAAVTIGCGGAPSSAPASNGPATATETATASAAPEATTAEAANDAASSAVPSKPADTKLKSEPKIWLSSDEVRDGWLQLFDGQTLFGWKANNDVDWHVTEDGLIEASQGPAGLLNTTVPFQDYEFKCEYWIEKKANSGVFLRTVESPKDPAADCYELNMWDAAPEFKTASLVKRGKPTKEVTGEEVWKSCWVKVEGPRITAKFDGEEVLDYTDESPTRPKTGFIGLQKNAGKVRFKNIALKPLGAKPLFNGSDLGGWKKVDGSKSEFSVVDSAIQVKNGPGFLESEGSWSDFVLQFEAKTNGDALNSGVFFRLIPGSKEAPSNGYEFQVQNGLKDGDRSKPADAGSGAIFRRTTARWVVANDREWFTATLIAHGPRFASWIDGVQVTDWEDDRAADANPRKGKKVEAGPISLQGHDPTTDLQFRNIRVAGEAK